MSGEIRAGAPASDTTGANAPCAWWQVAPAKGAPPHYSVCVDPEHFPLKVRSVEHGLNYVYVFSHWNETVITVPPGLIPPPPSSSP